jgi:hypothetical protein
MNCEKKKLGKKTQARGQSEKKNSRFWKNPKYIYKNFKTKKIRFYKKKDL